MVSCKICGSAILSIINYGKMPIANGFLKKPTDKEYFFTLAAFFCPSCYMVQLGETVKPELMFHDEYKFISSTSSAMADHFQQQAQEISTTVKKKKDPFVVELGSNDGIMLRHIAKKNIRHLGIEPAGNVADLAKKQGVSVLKKFFNQKTAKEIVKKHGQADVICGSNVTCHIEDLNSVAEGVSVLLKDDGVWFFEDPYMYDIVLKSSFDQMYDEHIYYFTGLSIASLAKRHGMQLVAMKHQDVHGGSMRYYLKKGTHNRIAPSVKSWIAKEKRLHLHQKKGYETFKKNVNKVCTDLRNLLKDLKRKGKSIAAYGATSKSTTLMTYAKIGPSLISYVSDNTPTKIGKYTPATHIPVKSHEEFLKNPPDYTVLLAWNHKKEIFKKEKAFRKKGGKFITFFPKVIVE